MQVPFFTFVKKTVDFVRLVAMEMIREASAGKNSIHGCHLLTLSLDFCCGAVVR